MPCLNLAAVSAARLVYQSDVALENQNNPDCHPLLRDIVAMIGNNEERLKDVRNALHHTGMDHENLTFRRNGLDERLTGVEECAVVKGVLA